MEPNWLQSLFWGIISGFAEILPVSAETHRLLLQKMTGIGDQAAVLRLVSQFAVLFALLLACRPRLSKFRRERKLARIPAKQRKRQPDVRTLQDARLLRWGMLPAVFSAALHIMFRNATPDLRLLTIVVTFNGVILFLPDRFPQGNKDSRSLTPLDGMLLGLCSALSAIPGLSGIGCAVSFGRLRGADGSYILDICLILMLPVLFLIALINGYAVFIGGLVISTALVFMCIACAAAAFIGAYYGIILMRFMAVKPGFSGFAYYCWGVALFSFILYLML